MRSGDDTMIDINQVLAENLSDTQRVAAMDDNDEILALACAGSGKSRTLAFRIARLVAGGVPPEGIVAFTFTEKAADSIKLRVARALEAAGLDPAVLGAMYLGTIHSYCRNVLAEMDARYRQFEVLDENRLKLYLISRFRRLGLHDVQQARGARYFETVKRVADAWATMNDELVSVAGVVRHDPVLGTTLQRLWDGLNTDQYIDFSLMIRLVVDALGEGDQAACAAVAGLRHLLVDEYQDVNPAQEALIRHLHRLSTGLFVVGDDDQSIYGWRGADVGNILGFEDRHLGCARHTLSRNYRSTPAIVATADAFAAAELGASRIAKGPDAIEPGGPRDLRRLWFDDRQSEAEWVAERIEHLLGTAYREQDGTIRGLTPGDFAILMRSTKGSERDGSPRHAAFTDALRRRGIAYSLEAGGGVFDRPQVWALRETFNLLRDRQPTRDEAVQHFRSVVQPAFRNADFRRLASVLTEWGRLIHAPITGPRRRVYPQQLVHDLLEAFELAHTDFDAGVMQDIGMFSRMIQDVEAVYLSVDSVHRFREILNFLYNIAESGYDTSTDDVLRRPDAVSVATIHKVKGLEFPAVFVVDVEASRFPGNRHGYEGWLPASVIGEALRRGAYQSTRDEEARLFYTAMTRAERYLYVSGAARLPGGTKVWQPSPFALRLAHPELSTDPARLPAGLEPHPRVPRIDETVMPTTYSDIRYYLRCPADYRYRKSFGFSPPIKEMMGFGMTVHAAVGRLHQRFRDRPPTGDEAEEQARDIFHLKHVPPSGDPENRPGAYEQARDRAGAITRRYAEGYRQDFDRRRQVEVRFEVPIENAVITGSIDLMLREDEEGGMLEASVVDFKTMEGGPEPEHNEELHWTELALQVQLYARAAREVLGENARTGAVHLLRDGVRVDVPVTDVAVQAAVRNVEWAVARVLAGDFPMRPHPEKCAACDFRSLCPQVPQDFSGNEPPPIHIPGDVTQMARAFADFVEGDSGVPK